MSALRLLALLGLCLAPSLFADDAQTFRVEEGALPWSDREAWVLAQVPASLKGSGPLPRQNCGSRSLDVPGSPAAITLGVYQKDLAAFLTRQPSARAGGETLAVTNRDGTTLTYAILTLERPAAHIDGTGLTAGLLLLGLSATGTAPAIPAPTPPGFNPRDHARFDLYVLMGQSNMIGRDTTGLSAQTPEPRIVAFGPDGSWKTAREPLNADGSGLGPGIPFASTLLAGDTVIGLIPTAVGGTPLSRWVKGGDLYEKAVRQVRAALQTGGRLRGLLWHQGESDCIRKTDADTYQARLVQMLADLRADLNRPDLPVVIGQLGDFVNLPFADTVRAALRDLPNRLENVAFVDSTGLPDKGDHLHFTTAAQQELGRRYAAALGALLAKQP